MLKKIYRVARAILAFPFLAAAMILGTIAFVIFLAGRKVMP